MDEEYLNLSKYKIENEIENLTFYRNLHIYLTLGYTFTTGQVVYEFLRNKFNNSVVYIPLILGSGCILKYGFKTVKKINYKLKKTKNILYMIECKDAVEKGLGEYTYRLKK